MRPLGLIYMERRLEPMPTEQDAGTGAQESRKLVRKWRRPPGLFPTPNPGRRTTITGGLNEPTLRYPTTTQLREARQLLGCALRVWGCRGCQRISTNRNLVKKTRRKIGGGNYAIPLLRNFGGF